MRTRKKINIRIHNGSDNNLIPEIINKFHVDLIENYLDELPLSNDMKIEIIDRIIDTLKSSGLIN